MIEAARGARLDHATVARPGVPHQLGRGGGRGRDEAGPPGQPDAATSSRSSAVSTAGRMGHCRSPRARPPTGAAWGRSSRASITSAIRTASATARTPKATCATSSSASWSCSSTRPSLPRPWRRSSSSPCRARADMSSRLRRSCPCCASVCDEHGILLVADEVQSGFGRTGKMFAVDHTGVEPDIMCLAKALGNGMPIAAMVARNEVMRAFHEGEHGTTYGGNPVACAAAIAVIDTLIRDRVPERAERIGREVMDRARAGRRTSRTRRRARSRHDDRPRVHAERCSRTRLVERITATRWPGESCCCSLWHRRQRHQADPATHNSRIRARCRPGHSRGRDARGDCLMAVVERRPRGREPDQRRVPPAGAGRTFESRNPANSDDVVGVFPRSDRPMSTPQSRPHATHSTPGAGRPGRLVRRSSFEASELLEERKEALAQLMTREMGKVLTEARGDVQEAIDMGKFIAGQGRRAYGETVPSELRDKWAMTMRQPFGVVGCITPWNFPIAIPSWKIFPAMMAGNTVVIKPAEDTPLCALRFVEALEDAGLPAGVVNVVFGFGEEAGAALVAAPRCRRDLLHRQRRHRPDRVRDLRPAAQEVLAGARWQERDRGARRRRRRARGRRRALGGVRHGGSALHRLVATDRRAWRARANSRRDLSSVHRIFGSATAST